MHGTQKRLQLTLQGSMTGGTCVMLPACGDLLVCVSVAVYLSDSSPSHGQALGQHEVHSDKFHNPENKKRKMTFAPSRKQEHVLCCPCKHRQNCDSERKTQMTVGRRAQTFGGCCCVLNISGFFKSPGRGVVGVQMRGLAYAALGMVLQLHRPLGNQQCLHARSVSACTKTHHMSALQSNSEDGLIKIW